MHGKNDKEVFRRSFEEVSNNIVAHEITHAWLIYGDLNRDAEDAKTLGWLERTAGLVTTTDVSIPIKIDSDRTYDHILIHPDNTTEYIREDGVIKFDETMFGNNDHVANLALSDHRPVRIKLKIPRMDDD